MLQRLALSKALRQRLQGLPGVDAGVSPEAAGQQGEEEETGAPVSG